MSAVSETIKAMPDPHRKLTNEKVIEITDHGIATSTIHLILEYCGIS
jgi:hypothetical protein